MAGVDVHSKRDTRFQNYVGRDLEDNGDGEDGAKNDIVSRVRAAQDAKIARAEADWDREFKGKGLEGMKRMPMFGETWAAIKHAH